MTAHNSQTIGSPEAVAAYVMKAFPKPASTGADYYYNQSYYALLNMLEAMKVLGIPSGYAELYAATSESPTFLDIYTRLANASLNPQAADTIDPIKVSGIFAHWDKFVEKTRSGYAVDVKGFKDHYGAIAARLTLLNRKDLVAAGT